MISRDADLAHHASIVYQKSMQIKRTMVVLGLMFQFFDVKGTQAYIASSKRRHTIVFRGTELQEGSREMISVPRRWWNLWGLLAFLWRSPDIKTDLKFKKVKWDVGRVHQGFAEAFERVWPRIEAALTELPNLRIEVTGHSLGGALAHLCAARLALQGRKVDLVTFGCPRVGNGTFARYVERAVSREVRYRNNNDVVTRIPLRIWGYRHVGKSHHFDRNGKLRETVSLWCVFWDRLLGRFKGGPVDGIKDHGMKGYKVLMERAAKEQS